MLSDAWVNPGYARAVVEGSRVGACIACSEARYLEWAGNSSLVPPEHSDRAVFARDAIRDLLIGQRSEYTLYGEYEFESGRLQVEIIPPDESCALCKQGQIRSSDLLKGVIVAEVPHQYSGPRFFSYTITPPRFARGPRKYGGSGETREVAQVKAIGEYFERSGAILDAKKVRTGTFQDLDVKADQPSRYEFYSEDQYQSAGFPFKPFTERSRVSWYVDNDVLTDEVRAVPRQLLSLHDHLQEGEQYIAHWNSTGLAFGTDQHFAVYRAVYEVLERDALANWWLNRSARHRIVNVPQIYEDVPGVEFAFYDFTTDLNLPAVLAVAWREHGGPRFAVGSALDLDPELAVRRAFDELVLTAEFAGYLIKYGNIPKSPADIRNFDDHCAYSAASNDEQTQALQFLNEAPMITYAEWKASFTFPRSFESLIEQLDASDLRPVVFDLTPHWLRDRGRVVRALIPNASKVHADHSIPFLGCSRLQSMMLAIGRSPLVPISSWVPHALP